MEIFYLTEDGFLPQMCGGFLSIALRCHTQAASVLEELLLSFFSMQDCVW